MDLSWVWEWDAVVWSPAVTATLARLSILWAGSGLSLGWVLVSTVADEYPVVHVSVCRSDGEGCTLGVRWNRRRALWACVKRAANYGVLRCNGACIRLRRGWRGLGWTQEVVQFAHRDSRVVDPLRCRILWCYGQGSGGTWVTRVRGR